MRKLAGASAADRRDSPGKAGTGRGTETDQRRTANQILGSTVKQEPPRHEIGKTSV